MPTPHFSFRLPAEKAEALREIAKIYGSANTSEFLRDLVSAIVAGEPSQLKAFYARLIAKAGEQLTLKLNAAVDSAMEPKQGKREPVRVKGRTNRGRTT